jgi:superoxide dismutase
MNTKYWSLILIIGSFVFAACNNGPRPELSAEAKEEDMHREHTNLADNLAHKGIIILEEQYKPPREFGYQIDTFFGSYLSLEEALVKGDTVDANSAAKGMKVILELIGDTQFDGEAQRAWENHKEGYLKNLTEFQHVKGLEEKRSYFSHISEILYCTFKSFDMEVGDIHVAYCPMAFDNKGAYWLTKNHKIRNPYFGDKMLKCGEIAEIIP